MKYLIFDSLEAAQARSHQACIDAMGSNYDPNGVTQEWWGVDPHPNAPADARGLLSIDESMLFAQNGVTPLLTENEADDLLDTKPEDWIIIDTGDLADDGG